MKLFQCQKCGQLLHFENTRCERCGSTLGYLSQCETMTALAAAPDSRNPEERIWRALVDQEDYRFCANSAHAVCNWLLPVTLPDLYCAACRHNRTIPDLSLRQNLNNWRAIEVAKIACSIPCFSFAFRSPPRRKVPMDWHSSFSAMPPWRSIKRR
jgi:hypothetical protein